MKKILNLFKVDLGELPEDIGTALSNRVVTYCILSGVALVTAVATLQPILIIGAVIVVFALFATLFHTFYLINKKKVLFVKGICTELCENKVMKHSSLCYIMFTSGGMHYKCTASPRMFKKVKAGMIVSVYATENAVRKDDQGCVRITNPLFFFSTFPIAE